jgi:hypothetical protein
MLLITILKVIIVAKARIEGSLWHINIAKYKYIEQKLKRGRNYVYIYIYRLRRGRP